jgi:predicted RNA-binding Zn-ribbon protein involved in translation (DUF1610 family)
MPLLFSKKSKAKPTGVTCEYCGWNGPKDKVIKAFVMNEDSTRYTINTCPNCLRNGGLVFHDEQ